MRSYLRRSHVAHKAVRFLFRGILRLQDEVQRRLYLRWLQDYSLSNTETTGQKKRSTRRFYEPLVSIVVPVYNTPEEFFRGMVASVRNQTYPNWELILVDDASTDSSVRGLIAEYSAQDRRIKYIFLNNNHHIAGATNQGIQHATGEFISLLDHDDILHPDALFEVVKALNQNEYDLIYTDEDKLEDKNRRSQPFLKPGWNPDFLHSVNYITHFVAIRGSVLEKYGGEDANYNGAQDWELFLRIARQIPEEKIYHVPKVLYSWRVHDASTAKAIEVKPYVVEAQRRAIQDDVYAKGYEHFNLNQDNLYPGQWHIEFKPVNRRSITIVLWGTKRDSLVRHSSFRTQHGSCSVVMLPRSASYKEIISVIRGEYVVFVDDSATPKHFQWVEELLGDAMRDGIGFVLARCSDDIAMANLGGILGKKQALLVKKMSRRSVMKHLYLTTRYNINTIYGGTVMIELEKLRSISTSLSGEFDIREVSALVGDIGCRNLYNPYVEVVK